MLKMLLSQVMNYFTKCVSDTSGSQYKPSFQQLLQDLSDPQSHLDQLPEKLLGNLHPVLTRNYRLLSSSPLLVQPKCFLKARTSGKHLMLPGTEHRFCHIHYSPNCCWLHLCLFYLTPYFCFKSEVWSFNSCKMKSGRALQNRTLLSTALLAGHTGVNSVI